MWPGYYDLPDPTVAYSFLVKVTGRIRISRLSPLVVQDTQGNLGYGAPLQQPFPAQHLFDILVDDFLARDLGDRLGFA